MAPLVEVQGLAKLLEPRGGRIAVYRIGGTARALSS